VPSNQQEVIAVSTPLRSILIDIGYDAYAVATSGAEALRRLGAQRANNPLTLIGPLYVLDGSQNGGLALDNAFVEKLDRAARPSC
jgi:hypothetical protein